MTTSLTPAITATTVRYSSIEIDGLNIAYREAGEESSPKLVLLHGWPSSSHQYRNLIPALAQRFHVIAPDYPGFGNSDTPDPAEFAYTFDRLADVTEHFLRAKGFERFGVFMQDYGGPVGFRIITRNPNAVEWLIIQNTNAYEVGFSEAWAGLRNALWVSRNADSEAAVEGLLELSTVKAAYLTGAKAAELISPDNWNSDYYVTLQRPHGRQLQMDLFYDYRSNVQLYPEWQSYLRTVQPKTLIFWGQGDIFFTPAGGEAYLKDLPNAEIHRLEGGHFAVEDFLDPIVSGMIRFYDTKVARAVAAK